MTGSLFAKQHPHPTFDVPPDRSRTNFFIITVETRAVDGPFSEAEFAAERSTRGVPSNLDFALVFASLEEERVTMATYNYRVKLSVWPVTACANGAQAAPVQPAAYAERYAV